MNVFLRKPLRQGPRFSGLPSFILASVMCTGSSPEHPTPRFSSSGAFDAAKKLHFPCFLFFFCWAIEAHHEYWTSRVFVAAIPWPFRPFPLRFRSRATHFHCDFTPVSVTVAALLASFWPRPEQSYCSFVAVQARPGIPLQFHRYACLSCLIPAPPRSNLTALL